jgi:hypothetical protein
MRPPVPVPPAAVDERQQLQLWLAENDLMLLDPPGGLATEDRFYDALLTAVRYATPTDRNRTAIQGLRSFGRESLQEYFANSLKYQEIREYLQPLIGDYSGHEYRWHPGISEQCVV